MTKDEKKEEKEEWEMRNAPEGRSCDGLLAIEVGEENPFGRTTMDLSATDSL